MRLGVVAICLCGLLHGLMAQPLPVVPMQFDPDRIFQSFRTTKPPMPAGDCAAFDVSACNASYPEPVKDIALRWVQLDDDADLEAILTVEAEAQRTNRAFVFDKQKSWRMVGVLGHHRGADFNTMVRVARLTTDSPPLVVYSRDLGGSAHVLVTATAFHLRGGKLWPAFEIVVWEGVFLDPELNTKRYVYASENRLVIHTIRTTSARPGERHACEVMRWSSDRFSFVPSRTDRAEYCDVRSGRPVAGKSHLADLPVYP